jgi:hypothetical protein
MAVKCGVEYPTEIRNSGTGLAYGTGRLANVFGPLLVARLYTHHGYTAYSFTSRFAGRKFD